MEEIIPVMGLSVCVHMEEYLQEMVWLVSFLLQISLESLRVWIEDQNLSDYFSITVPFHFNLMGTM